jgi:hypothetical protein
MEKYSGLTPEQIEEYRDEHFPFSPWYDNNFWDQFPFKAIDEQDISDVSCPADLGWTGPE